VATASSSTSQSCSQCGSALTPGDLACARCGRYFHANELSELATRARQLTAMGQLSLARQHWQAALNLLPPGSNEYQAVAREIVNLDARLNPKPKTDWTKKLGPFGVVIAFLLKFKTAILIGLTKGKAALSLLAFFGMYWSLFGWWFAVGMCGSIFIHEMGHYVVVRRFGFAAELPMFIPGLGAYVKWNGANVDVGVRSLISLAGPFFGFLSGLMFLAIYWNTGHGVWLAVAHFAGWLNLVNLIPVAILDGGAGMSALGKQERWIVLFVSLLLLFYLGDFWLLLVAIGAGYRLWKRDFPLQSRPDIGYYFAGLVAANAILSWYTMHQSRFAFGGI
jgi:Zn-dependent protease